MCDILALIITKKGVYGRNFVFFLQVIIGGSNLDCVARLDVDEIKVNITFLISA